MLTKDFLLEIGIEEIPAGFAQLTRSNLLNFFKDLLQNSNLNYKTIKIFSTPRRFAIIIKELEIQQKDTTIEKIGPAKRIALDEEGNLTKAGNGFVRGSKAKKEDIYIKKTKKGEYIAVKISNKGALTKDILTKNIPDFFTKIQFPKSMKWGKTKLSFARPIRWIVCLWDSEILNLEINELTSSNISYGNRFQKLKNNITIDSPDTYENTLLKVKVVADRNERINIINRQISEIMTKENLIFEKDDKLLETVTDLIEFPTAILGKFDKKYLDLPQKIITSTLSQHQKYFSVKSTDNKITNKFICISNGKPINNKLIKYGNEKVIKARLEDAQFFYNEDTKIKLEEFYSKLEEVTFQANLGSLKQKTERIIEIATYLAKKINLNKHETALVARSAKLCKCDLVTLMLGEKEFTKLQGYIGKNYALTSGEPKEVADAIYEHYMPRGYNDKLPSSLISSLVAIADKLDTVCGIISVNLLPTGSNDPFALRRATNGIVQIIENLSLNINIIECIDFSFSLLNKNSDIKNNNITFVKDYFKQRICWLLEQKNIDYDIIDSVINIDFSNITNVKQKCNDIQYFRKQDDFIKLVLGFKRVSNILSKQKEKIEKNPQITLFVSKEENDLYNTFKNDETKIKQLLQKNNYKDLMELLVSKSKYIDNFFDNVMVNDKNEKIKNNRFSLLNYLNKIFLNIADLNKIVVEK